MGRGIARIDPKDLEGMGAATGDIVQIVGKQRTVAKAMPAYMDTAARAWSRSTASYGRTLRLAWMTARSRSSQ